MELRNLTPFHALSFDGTDTDDQRFHVVVMRVGYRLVPSGARPPAMTHRATLLEGDDAAPLSMEDVYFGAPHESGVREESDLAQYKPRCDVLVRATAHAPGQAPAAHWQVRVKVSCPETLAEEGKTEEASQDQEPARKVLLDKTLAVHGPRWFIKDPSGWTATDAEAARAVPMRWEHAFGGRCRVESRDLGAPVLHEVCFLNPLGAGWLEERYLDALRDNGDPVPDRIPAPQIEYPEDPVRAPRITRHPGGDIDAHAMAEVADDYGHRPAGLGPLGRAWTPRLQRAGTYDVAWQEERWPKSPLDFDPLYWNAAPDDQQIDYPPPDARIELFQLTPEGYLSVELPGHRALVLWRCEDGQLLPAKMDIDTLLIDAEAMTLDVVWRAVLPADIGVRVAEARFEIDPQAPLLVFVRGERPTKE
ncbi:MAG: DUF2169 domain-containing protein [Polyangiaceae bacterium]